MRVTVDHVPNGLRPEVRILLLELIQNYTNYYTKWQRGSLCI